LTYTPEQLAKLRHRCQTDLYFLGREVLKKDFVETPHKAMCDFYVKKDPSFKTFKEFAQQYTGPHDRMQLVPRETYKSSIKVVDNVQWIINFKEIRILTVTAENDLAEAFINQLTNYFVVRGKAERNPETNLLEGGNPTVFQELFPEHCVTESEGIQGEFTTPARRPLPPNLVEKETTAGTISMQGTSSGWHSDVTDFDDPISDRNSETGNQLEKLRNRISMINELVMNYGFTNYVATRYDPSDPYGVIAESHDIRDLYGDFEADDLLYMCRPCLWLKGEKYKQPNYDQGFPTEESVDLFFPEGSPYKALKKKFKNRKIFFSQQLNDPQRSASVEFTDELLRACLIDHSALPRTGLIFASWDLAVTAKRNSDESCGIVGLIDDQRRWWIIDIVKGRFNFSERCHQVVKTIGIHHPRRTCIEDEHGTQDNLSGPLDRAAKEAKIPLDVDWISLGKGTKDAKYVRICGLHPWMTSKRLYFLNSIPYVDELIRQFKNAKPQNSSADEIPDAMSRLVEQYTRFAAEVKAPSTMDDERRWQELSEKDFHDMIYGKGRYTPVEPLPKENPQEAPSYAIDELFQ
jgi:phage terminase large subunit-like protein